MSEKRKRNKTLTVRLTEKEYTQIRRNAKRAQKSITDYIVAISNEIPITVSEDVKPLIAEMKRIGNNLNQIARKANSRRFFFAKFDSVIEGQRKIYDAILDLKGDDS